MHARRNRRQKFSVGRCPQPLPRAGDAHDIKFTAIEMLSRYRRAHILPPDNAAVHSVKCIHIIRFGDRNDHWAAWTALDVKRLRVNVAYDRAVKIHVAGQIRRSRLREGRIDIKAITRTMVVKLRNVHLRIC
jgi:hypothetical protein